MLRSTLIRKEVSQMSLPAKKEGKIAPLKSNQRGNEQRELKKGKYNREHIHMQSDTQIREVPGKKMSRDNMELILGTWYIYRLYAEKIRESFNLLQNNPQTWLVRLVEIHPGHRAVIQAINLRPSLDEDYVFIEVDDDQLLPISSYIGTKVANSLANRDQTGPDHLPPDDYDPGGSHVFISSKHHSE